MRLASPVNAPDEVERLHRAGADECYCGYMPQDWARDFGNHDSASRRQGAANISDPELLSETVSEARRVGMPIFLTLNARVVREQLPRLLAMAELFAAFGGSGIVLRDIVLLRQLYALALPMRYTASLLSVTVNEYGVRMWRELGANRIVLPRFLTVSEMGSLARACPGTEFEAMVLGDRCLFIDGYCSSIHCVSYRKAPPDAEPQYCLPVPDPSAEAHHLCFQYREHASVPCAACRFRELDRAGINIGKLGGRGLPTDEKIKRLMFLRETETMTGEQGVRELCHRKYNGQYECYYPETEDSVR